MPGMGGGLSGGNPFGGMGMGIYQPPPPWMPQNPPRALGGGNPFMGGGGPVGQVTPKVIATVPAGGGGGMRPSAGGNPFAQQQGPGLQVMQGGGGWGGWGGPQSPFSRMPQMGGNPFLSQAMGMGMPPNRHPGWMQQGDIRQQSAGGLRGQQGGPGQFPTRARSRFNTDFGMGRLQGLQGFQGR